MRGYSTVQWQRRCLDLRGSLPRAPYAPEDENCFGGGGGIGIHTVIPS